MVKTSARLLLIASATLLATPGVASPEPPFAEREVAFQSLGVLLRGTLLLPPATAPRGGGVVLLSGSRSGPRGELRSFAERFAAAGVAALIFDKRGSGQSEGSWLTASLDDLADDAIAAAALLKGQPEVDAQRVGVWGISQAGWVIPRALAKNPNSFAFAIVITGGGIRPIELERFDYRAALDHLGVDVRAKREGLSLVEMYFGYLHGSVRRADLEVRLARARSKPWYSAVDVSRVMPDESARPKWSWVADYDPGPDIERIQVPALIVLGGADRHQVAVEAEKQWRSALARAENRDAVVAFFLAAGHGITVGGSHESPHHQFAPGYLEMVVAWLAAHAR